MGIIPDKYISELFRSLKRKTKAYNETPMSGWLALSPLFVFLSLYLVSSIIANDFYKIPISAAFLQQFHSLFRIRVFSTDAAAKGRVSFYSVQIVAVDTDAAHISQRVSFGTGDADDETVGDGEYLGLYTIGSEDAIYTFFNTIGFSATNG